MLGRRLLPARQEGHLVQEYRQFAQVLRLQGIADLPALAGLPHQAGTHQDSQVVVDRITSYNVCYTKLLRMIAVLSHEGGLNIPAGHDRSIALRERTPMRDTFPSSFTGSTAAAALAALGNPMRLLARITSYNVCYTKLLRARFKEF